MMNRKGLAHEIILVESSSEEMRTFGEMPGSMVNRREKGEE